MKALAVLVAAAALLVVSPAGAPAKKKGRTACAPAAAAAMRPSPVKVHRRGRAKSRALAARACSRSGRLVGFTGAGRAGAPASFGVLRPFAGSPAPPVQTDPSPVPTATPTPTGPDIPTIPENPRALQVQAFEYGLKLSKASVLSGGVKVEFNSARAEDPHNLFLARTDGTGSIYSFDEQGPGAVTSKTVSLSTGRWRLFCSLPGHEELGMKATLTVSAG